MPYGATEADLRTHFRCGPTFSNRHSGGPRNWSAARIRVRGIQERALAEAAIAKFDQQPFLGRALSVSEARPRESGRRADSRGRQVPVGSGSRPQALAGSARVHLAGVGWLPSRWAAPWHAWPGRGWA
jgi:hypothetical protein